MADAVDGAHAAFADALEELVAIDAAAEVDVGRRRLWFFLQIWAQRDSVPSY
jgi:hypothetical protein